MSTYENRPYSDVYPFVAADFASEVDLQDAEDARGPGRSLPARKLMITDQGGGTIAFRTAAGRDRTFTVQPDWVNNPGIFDSLQVTAILDTTDCDVMVYW